MTRALCPICSKSFEVNPTALPPGFPFCSERCRLIDLGRWLDGAYSIPSPPAVPDPEARSGGDAAPPKADEAVEDSDS